MKKVGYVAVLLLFLAAASVGCNGLSSQAPNGAAATATVSATAASLAKATAQPTSVSAKSTAVTSTSAARATTTPTTSSQLANPASQYCVKQGGKVDIRDGQGGQTGYCVFNDGSECEEWAYFRGECQPGKSAASGQEPSTDELAALVKAQLPKGAFEGVHVASLASPDSRRPYWIASSYGLRDFYSDPLPSHFVAVYTHDSSGWVQIDRMELDQALDTAEMVSPDYVSQQSVKPVSIDASLNWIEVSGGVGAHGGTYQLLSFDGNKLKIEVSASSSSPALGELRDVNGDGRNDVVLNVSDRYVFCYACGVRQIQYVVWAWDAQSKHMAEVTLQPIAQASQPGREEANRAVQLAKAGLWKDAMAKIEEAKKKAPSSGQTTGSSTLGWDYALIKLHVDEMVKSTTADAYPLLATIFYGDYASALNIARPYGAKQIFSQEPSLVKGTPAEGNEDLLSERIFASTTSALDVEPTLAEAYFFRGWARYLVNPVNAEIRSDLAKAAQLNPNETLYKEALTLIEGQ